MLGDHRVLSGGLEYLCYGSNRNNFPLKVRGPSLYVRAESVRTMTMITQNIF